MGIFCFFKSSQENKKNEDTFVLTLIDDKEEIPKEITLKIHVCGINKDDPRISNIYTSTINNVKDQCKGDFECHQSLYYWIIKLYSKELNEDTFNEICEEIRKDRDTQAINIKQNTILYFEDDPKDSEQKNLLIQKIQDLGFVYRPRIIFITKQKYSFNMIDNRYITNIIWNDNSEEGRYKFIQLITSTIWNIDCYYNERLDEKIILELDESNVILKKLKDNINDYSFNILLSGLSRAGKSSFINLMTGKLSALESNDKESVTSKITDYFIYPPKIESDKNNHLCSIKLIDSPGIVLNFMDQCQNQKTVINNIKEAINDNSINKIDIVLFFFKEGDSLETSIEVLKMLNDNNCTVLFIINHSTEDEESGQREISATISFLNQNDCLNINKKENFIPTNFKKSKRMDFFGMKEIWKRIYDIIDKENPSFNEDNEQLIKDLSNDVFGISEEMNKDKKIADFKKIISKNNIFKKINEKNIIEKCNNMVEKLCNNINYLLSVNGKYNNNDDEKYKYLAILIIEIGKRFGFQNKIIENKLEALIRFLWDFNLEEKKKTK
jgi:GTP-binding protein EngB required for normal cell division